MNPNQKTCGCIGCTEPADAVIERRGAERTVCDDHADGYPVVEVLE